MVTSTASARGEMTSVTSPALDAGAARVTHAMARRARTLPAVARRERQRRFAVRGHIHVPGVARRVDAASRERLLQDLVFAPESVLSQRHHGRSRARVAQEVAHVVFGLVAAD